MNKICRCGRVIPSSIPRCDECQIRHDKDKKTMAKEYNRVNRNKKSQAFYSSQEWIRLREYVISKYNGLDIYDYYINKKITYCNTVHHIEELTDNWDRRLDPLNMFPLSNSNHNKIHGMYKKNKRSTQRFLYNLLDRWDKEHT